MNPSLKSVIIFLGLIVFSGCNREVTLSEYKYSDKELNVTCSQINPDLLKEAVYSFEEDITKHFVINGRQNLYQAYAKFVNFGFQGQSDFSNIISDHTVEIFKIIKRDPNLWEITENSVSLNYNHELMKCIGENLIDKDLKTTFNALLTTNSMNTSLIVEPLKRKYSFAITDKYLATYIALDFYYTMLFNVDLETKKSLNPSNKISTIKPKPKGTDENKVDPHEGHNH